MTAEVKKRGLGRGLDALFSDARSEEAAFEKYNAPAPAPRVMRADEMLAAAVATTASVTQSPMQRKISIERLKPGKFQPRHHFDEAAIESLAESIAVHGVLQPLLVRSIPGGMFEIIAGERRWRAAQKAQVHEVPVIVEELSDNDALEIALIENLQREDLTALEEAEGYQRLMDEFRHTQDVLAHRLGKSRSHVANMLRLLKLPAKVKQYMQEGLLSAGHARTLVGCDDAEKIATVIVKRGLNVRQAERLVKEAVAGKMKAKKPQHRGFVPKDVDILALEERMTSLLGMRVTVEGSGMGGTLKIEYKSLEQLDDVLQRLSKAPIKY
jgi:ParB family chromosome partitioning protein